MCPQPLDHGRQEGPPRRAFGTCGRPLAPTLDEIAIAPGLSTRCRLTPAAKGLIAESQATIWLIEHLLDVWTPANVQHRADLGVGVCGRLLRLQVKAASYNRQRRYYKVSFRRGRNGRSVRYTTAEIDYFVIYCGGL